MDLRLVENEFCKKSTIVFIYQPLVAKDNWGVEINPLKIILADQTFSAGINYFDYKNNAEIAIPISIYNTVDEYTYKVFNATIDLRYRKFLYSIEQGHYFGILLRYAFLEGKLLDDHRLAKLHKLGLGLETGYRDVGIFGNENIYWGASFAIGRYYSDHNGIFQCDALEICLEDSSIFFDIELFKVGYTF